MTESTHLPLPACMGGFCANRDACGRYHQRSGREEPAERLCAPGEANAYRPLGFHPQPLRQAA